MTFGQLKNEVRRLLFPDRESSNLVAVHDAYFVEALWDLQNAVECYLFNQTFTFAHCASFFQCGLTVIPKPDIEILAVYVIDKINPDTGLEDADAPDDWCKKIYYKQVDYCHIHQYVKLCQCCSSTSVLAVADAIVTSLFGIYRRKRCYPAPTDEGLNALPRLPQGFHYPQTSTDDTGRSPSGVWAIYRGKIYVAPWIQSTETLVIEGNGIKRTWSDNDLVDDDPKFKQAVRLSVAIQHYESFEENPGKLAEFKSALYGDAQQFGVLPELMKRCRDENRIRLCNEAGSKGAAARGLGASNLSNNIFYNDRQEYTAACPSGQTGDSVTAVVDAGTVGSALSVADANAKAKQQATDEASSRLVCITPPVTYWNVAQSYVATCTSDSDHPAPDGSPVSVVISAHTYSSTVSQADADSKALAAATSQALSQLVCTFWNKEQSYTADCGTEESVTKSAHTYSSGVSQDDADAKAANAAKIEAEIASACPIIYHNTAQTRAYNNAYHGFVVTSFYPPSTIEVYCVMTVNATVPANQFTSTVSQVDANNQAASYAMQRAQAYGNAQFAQYQTAIAMGQPASNQYCGTFNITVTP